jgi:probable HAF family extracellular repeat protein
MHPLFSNSHIRAVLFAALSLSILAAALPAGAASIRAQLQLLPSIEADVVRWEARAINPDGSLVVGNLQYADNTFKAVYWVRTRTGWDLRTIPGGGARSQGFVTFSALNTGTNWTIVGRDLFDGRIEGVAYNYVSGQLIRGGALPEYSGDFLPSRFTGVNQAANLFVGTAPSANNILQPVLMRAGQSLEKVPMPEGATGGWLYVINSAGTVGAGELYFPADNAQGFRTAAARWSPEEGMVLLPVPDPEAYASVLRISPQGRFIIGRAAEGDGMALPAYWDSLNGFAPTFLPLPEELTIIAVEVNAMNEDGSMVFGSLLWETEPGIAESRQWHAIVWHPDGTIEFFDAYIQRNYGLSLPAGAWYRGAQLDEESRNFFGNIQYADGRIGAYVIILDSRADGFELLGYPVGSQPIAEARAVSDDGAMIVGIGAGMNGQTPAYWSPATGWRFFDFLSGSTFTNYYLPANDVTPDGRVVVGRTPGPDGRPAAFIAVETEVAPLGFLAAAPNRESRATGVAHDGSVVVGTASLANNQLHAFAWTAVMGMQALPVPEEAGHSWAYQISGDGHTAGGWITLGASQPALWDLAAGGAYRLLQVPEGYIGGSVQALNHDGSIAIGALLAPNNANQPAWWDAAGDAHLIPFLPEHAVGTAWSITDDGALIAGQMLLPDLSAATGFLYSPTDGLHTLHSYMVNYHGRIMDPDFTPRTLNISANGRHLIGDVRDPIIAGSRVPFRVKVPEATARDYFGDGAEPIGDTAFSQTWFGLINDTAFPLVHHQDHGWLVLRAWGESGGYAFDPLLGWLFIARDTYPVLQVFGLDEVGRWYHYDEGSSSPRWFFDLAAGAWVSEDELHIAAPPAP